MFSYKNYLAFSSIVCILALVHTQQEQLKDVQKIQAESQSLKVTDTNPESQIPQQPKPSQMKNVLLGQPLATQPSPFDSEQDYLAYEAGVEGAEKKISEIQLTYRKDIGSVKVVKFTNGLTLIIPQESKCKQCCGPQDNICLFCCDPRA